MSLNEQRESSVGFHFLQAYQNCPRQFFIKYILGYLPEKIASYLVMGKVFHAAAAFVAEFDTEGTLAWEVLEAFMKADFAKEAEGLDTYTDAGELYAILATLVKSAIPQWEKDHKLYKFVAVEKEILVALANG